MQWRTSGPRAVAGMGWRIARQSGFPFASARATRTRDRRISVAANKVRGMLVPRLGPGVP